MFVKILKAFKYVRLLEQEIDDLNKELSESTYEVNLMRDVIAIKDKGLDKMELEKEHYRGMLVSLISKPHMGMKKKGTVRYTIQDSEMDEALELELIEENNFPSRSTTIYARSK